jgi:hypothetical protein
VPLLDVLVLLGVDEVAAFAIAAPPAASEPVTASVVSSGLSLRIVFTSFARLPHTMWVARRSNVGGREESGMS